ncbi:sensor histidine kinase [Polluticaenibacter yanchengensis]|uniref:histidine kinase n=1 Tax=Polluticaenibacter yanchengensis TaxID=3014562 RepID=A0ABT4UNR1_9BACT|nr:HAMP domain-containing sensor histidine kinase [Chitinophagaceae bacterium LY-5]
MNYTKQHKRLQVALFLMILSIALVVLFQLIWIRKNFTDEVRRLRREAGLILREDLLQKQLQNISKNKTTLFEPLKAGRSLDSLFRNSGKVQQVIVTNTASFSPGGEPKKFDIKTRYNERLRIFPEDREKESISKTLQFYQPLFFKIDNIDSVQSHFNKNLKTLNINISFELKTVKYDSSNPNHQLRFPPINMAPANLVFPGGPPPNGNFQPIFGNPDRNTVMVIEATSDNYIWYVLSKIAFTIYASVFMLAIITSAFIFLYRSLKKQHKLAELKNNLFNNITHELKTPVATVSVAIEALKQFNVMNDTKRTEEYLNISSQELERLNILIDNVLKISTFEQNKLTINTENIDLEKIIISVIESLKLQFQKYNTQVDVLGNGSNFNILADQTHIQSIIYNLIDNALKYSTEEPEIDIQLHENADTISLEISDNGIGIDPEYQGKVFEKFFRVPTGDKHNVKGYGLGLSYVYEVVKQYGGAIHCYTNSKKGTTFMLTFQKATV